MGAELVQENVGGRDGGDRIEGKAEAMWHLAGRKAVARGLARPPTHLRLLGGREESSLCKRGSTSAGQAAA